MKANAHYIPAFLLWALVVPVCSVFALSILGVETSLLGSFYLSPFGIVYVFVNVPLALAMYSYEKNRAEDVNFPERYAKLWFSLTLLLSVVALILYRVLIAKRNQRFQS